MAHAKIPKDLGEVKSKIFLNLTKRQIICFMIGAILGISEYISFKDALGSTTASFFMIMIMVPLFVFSMYEKDGRYLERIIFNYVASKVLRPKRRMYKKRRQKGEAV